MTAGDKKMFFGNIFISIIAIILTQLLAYKFQQSHDLQSREYERIQLASAHENERDSSFLSNEDINDLLIYRNYYTIDWQGLDKMIFTPYWCSADDALLATASKNNVPDPCTYWRQLQAAKITFHRLTWKARIFGSDALIDSLNNIELGFDRTFTEYVNQEYYSRSEIDSYQNTMPKKFDEFESVIRHKIREN